MAIPTLRATTVSVQILAHVCEHLLRHDREQRRLPDVISRQVLRLNFAELLGYQSTELSREALKSLPSVVALDATCFAASSLSFLRYQSSQRPLDGLLQGHEKRVIRIQPVTTPRDNRDRIARVHGLSRRKRVVVLPREPVDVVALHPASEPPGVNVALGT